MKSDANFSDTNGHWAHGCRWWWWWPLRVRSAERRHQSPEWTVLSQVNCVVHIEVAGFQILLNGFHPCNTRTSKWSPPVSCAGSCWDLFCICFIRHSCNVSEEEEGCWTKTSLCRGQHFYSLGAFHNVQPKLAVLKDRFWPIKSVLEGLWNRLSYKFSNWIWV